MARRSDHSHEEIRDMALEAAERIIVEHGHDGLTARKVASEIGYTVGALYLVFENLDDLIMHINARTLDRLHRLMTDGDTQDLKPEDRVNAPPARSRWLQVTAESRSFRLKAIYSTLKSSSGSSGF